MEFFSANDSNDTKFTCIENIENITDGLTPYRILTLLVPTSDRVWLERDEVWNSFFKVITAVLALIYLLLGILSVTLIVRKNSLRLNTRTFLAVYTTIAILGFSRALFLALDPTDIVGFIPFPAWIVISRFVRVIGFPSLVASCTLIILTLWKLVNAGSGKQWYEYWSYTWILTGIPYGMALGAEAMAYTSTYPALLSGISCEILFVAWGMTICIAYLIAGIRLLHRLEKSHRKATRTSGCQSLEVNHSDPRHNTYAKHNRKVKKIARKISKITFGTAITGVLYSVTNAGAVVMILLLLFHDCMGLNQRTDPIIWLVVTVISYILEVVLGLLALYSITDVSEIVNFLKRCNTCIAARGTGGVNLEDMELSQNPETTTSQLNDEMGMCLPDDTAVDMEQGYEGHDTVITSSGESTPMKIFAINIQRDSDTSIESEGIVGIAPNSSTLEGQEHSRHNNNKAISQSEASVSDKPMSTWEIISVRSSTKEVSPPKILLCGGLSTPILPKHNQGHHREVDQRQQLYMLPKNQKQESHHQSSPSTASEMKEIVCRKATV